MILSQIYQYAWKQPALGGSLFQVTKQHQDLLFQFRDEVPFLRLKVYGFKPFVAAFTLEQPVSYTSEKLKDLLDVLKAALALELGEWSQLCIKDFGLLASPLLTAETDFVADLTALCRYYRDSQFFASGSKPWLVLLNLQGESPLTIEWVSSLIYADPLQELTTANVRRGFSRLCKQLTIQSLVPVSYQVLLELSPDAATAEAATLIAKNLKLITNDNAELT